MFWMAGREVVDADHGLTVAEQHLDGVRADEPGGAGDDPAPLLSGEPAFDVLHGGCYRATAG